MKKTLYIFSLLILFSCSLFVKKKQEQKKPIARVYEKYLYPSDLEGIIGKNTSTEDSLNILRKYVDAWVKQNLIVHQAEENLNEDQKDFKKQLENYRNTLLTFVYEQELIRQKLDTIILQKEIQRYYDMNKANFELKTNIIKMLYAKLGREDAQIDTLRIWMRSQGPIIKEKLRDYCLNHAINYSLDEDSWYLFDDILKEIPIKTYNQEHFLSNNKYVETFDSAYVYMVYIKDFKIKEDISPLSYVADKIHQILLNKRKLELIDNVYRNIYQGALKNNDYEIYF